MQLTIATITHWRRLFAVIVAVLGLLAGAPVSAKNLALLVAVGQFRNPDVPQLYGTAADIDSMQQSLTQRWGFDPSDVIALRDKDATRDRILTEISALEQRSAAGDIVLIYFSGHGTSANDQNNAFDLPYATGAWVPYDFDPASPLASLIVGRRDLVPRLAQLDKTDRWVVVVSDSCYSGQVVRSLGHRHGRSRYLPLHVRDLGIAGINAPATPSARPPPPPYPYRHVVLLSGASDSEEGTDISTAPDLQQWPTLDGQFHGAFTDAFLRLLNGQLVQGTFSYAKGRDALNQFLEHRNFPQHPQLLPVVAEDPDNVGSNLFLGAKQSVAAISPDAAGTRTTLHVRLEGASAALRASIAALSGIEIAASNAELTVRQSGAQVQLLGPADDPILSTTASDPNLLRRIAAQAWVSRALPVGIDELGLRAESDPGSRGNTFVECESFVFEIRLQKPAYVMLVDLDPNGDLTVLYPTSAAERRIIASGAARAVPSSDPSDRIFPVAPFGSDQVTVLAFNKMPDFFEGLNSSAKFPVDGARADSLAKGYAQFRGAVSAQRLNIYTYPGNKKGSCGA
jgi:Caspase domain/Domain of unknown function (DUF4384)